MHRVGLISDTHGLLRPEARSFLAGSDHIIHAGDICDPAILDELAAIAPLTAVRGNNDSEPWALQLPEVAQFRVDDVLIQVVHDLAGFAFSADLARARVVVSGHSHKPAVLERDGVLHVNPGSAGPRRFRLPVSAGEILIEGSSVHARTVSLLPPAEASLSGTRRQRR